MAISSTNQLAMRQQKGSTGFWLDVYWQTFLHIIHQYRIQQQQMDPRYPGIPMLLIGSQQLCQYFVGVVQNRKTHTQVYPKYNTSQLYLNGATPRSILETLHSKSFDLPQPKLLVDRISCHTHHQSKPNVL